MVMVLAGFVSATASTGAAAARTVQSSRSDRHRAIIATSSRASELGRFLLARDSERCLAVQRAVNDRVVDTEGIWKIAQSALLSALKSVGSLEPLRADVSSTRSGGRVIAKYSSTIGAIWRRIRLIDGVDGSTRPVASLRSGRVDAR